ncbi:MAG TPA: hypothetical protein VIN40_02745, partial [Candidatus Tyrphobacter sp.]
MAASTARFGARRARRRSDAPSAHVSRIGSLLVRLLRDEVLDYATCIDRFGISRREFQRDLLKIRKIGEAFGFTVSQITGGRVFLHTANKRVQRLSAKHREEMATVGRIASALRGPVEREMRTAIEDLPGNDSRGFLHVRE